MMRATQMVRVAVAVLLMGGICPIQAQDARPDARLQFSSFSVGLLFGYSQGEGTLDFAGRQYPFTVSGITLATVGISQVSAVGQVYRLREAADLAGRYAAIEGALTLGQGGGSAVLRNAKGVTLYLQNVQQGLEVTLGGGGLSIALTEPTEGVVPAGMENVPAR
ncbi:MAG TPA: hypothetical protein PL166_09530 [Candidatus Contendobacter sp.]|nr:hypothetical protein [Candidatus Contendobacter sp.]HRD49824.1 hypothetical protein [Candidatus Contendobacter sp.]